MLRPTSTFKKESPRRVETANHVMRKDLQDALYADFPQLYREHAVEGSCMRWGICTDDGWEPLIRRLSEKITAIIEQLKKSGTEGWEDIAAAQVKEKYGGLRFYMRRGSEEIREAIHEAKEEAYRTCEACGAEGSLRDIGGWYTCICDACSAERETSTDQ